MGGGPVKNLRPKLFRPNGSQFLRIILRQIFQIPEDVKRKILRIAVLIVRNVSDTVQANIIGNVSGKGTGGYIGHWQRFFVVAIQTWNIFK